MACGATLSLKRAMALDPVQSPKRRRFGPAQPSASSPSSATPSAAAAAASASRHHSSSPMRRYLSVDPSPFAEVSPRVTAEQLVASIRQEFRRLQRRKHLDPAAFVSPACPPPSPPSPSPPPSPPSEQMEAGSPPPAPQSLHGDAGVSPCLRSVPAAAAAALSAPCPHRDPPGPLLLTAAAAPTHHSSPLLTLRQVALICERAMREREDSLREEYEGVLTTKLSEQYDAFVKFNHDQMLRRYGERPASYVS
ncbi:akirin-2-like isoform X3 [Petromyzon marinus]|uniref:akirin-2-like isoform X3 n=1 Tax=Petromyzon marinus TaxID=7757 RepID=UPI003F7038F2